MKTTSRSLFLTIPSAKEDMRESDLYFSGDTASHPVEYSLSPAALLVEAKQLGDFRRTAQRLN